MSWLELARKHLLRSVYVANTERSAVVDISRMPVNKELMIKIKTVIAFQNL